MAFSLRTAIIAGVLIYLSMVVNDGFLDQWQWSHIYPSLLSLLSAYVFVAVFSLVLCRLSIQKERAETLLHQLEASNAELEEAHRQLQKYASEVEELAGLGEDTRPGHEKHDNVRDYPSAVTMPPDTTVT